MKNPSKSEHENRNEGGREFGHVHQPNQAEQASKNKGLADESMGNRQPLHAPGHQQAGSESSQETGSQHGKPPGNISQNHERKHQKDRERKSA